MNCSPLPNDPLKPEQDLYNISFFQLSQTYQILSLKKPKRSKHAQFSSWSDKDQQFFNFSFQDNTNLYGRKISADTKVKRTSYQKYRINHSVTFHPNRVDLGSKMPESSHKFSINTKSKSMFIPNVPKTHLQLNRLLQNKSQIIEKSKEKRKQMQKRKQKLFMDNPERQSELSKQPSYNLINYPIAIMMRKRKFKKMQKFPFPSLAQRLNK